MEQQFTPEERAAMVKCRPTSRLVDRRCELCGHTWTQPSPTGKCPKCYSSQTVNVGEGVSTYKTV